MTLPDTTHMLVLLGLETGEGLIVEGNQLALTLPGSEPAPVPDEVLDALESRGWVEIGEAGAVITEQGKYALGVWFRKRAQAQGHRGRMRFTMGRITGVSR